MGKTEESDQFPDKSTNYPKNQPMKLPANKIGIPGISVAIFVAIMLLLSFYFFVTMSSNRQNLEEQGFRSLNQLAGAMKDQDKVIERLVNHFSKTIENSPEARECASEQKKQKEDRKKNLSLFSKSTFNDNILFGGKSILEKPENIIYTIDTTESSPDNSAKGGNSANKQKKAGTPTGKKNSNNQPSGAGNKAETSQKDRVVCSISVKNFLSPLLRKEFFTDYLLIRNNELVFSSARTEMKLYLGDGKKPESKNISLCDAAVKSDSSSKSFIKGGFIQKVRLNGLEYQLFLIPVGFHDKNEWFLGGLINIQTVNSLERGLPFYQVVIFLLIFSFIIFSLPILKVFIAGPNERFTRSLAGMVGISVVSVTLITAILFAEALIHKKNRQEANTNLKTLNDTIVNAFTKERHSILDQLTRYDAISAGRTGAITEVLLNKETNPAVYRYFKMMFRTDKSGNMTFMISPYDSDNSPKSNVHYRDYFKNPEKFHDSIGNYWYTMDPVYSNTTGEWLIAFSKRSESKQDENVVVITSFMNSLKSPVLQDDYEYCLVDRSGKVWYHSKEIFNLSDNLTDECNDHAFITMLNDGNSGYLDINLRNKDFMTYLQPVPATDLFLITLFNPRKVIYNEAQASTFTFGCFGVILCILIILYFVFRLPGFIWHKDTGDSFFRVWLYPSAKNIRAYRLLLRVNILVTALLLLLDLSGILQHCSFAFVLFGVVALVVVMCVFNSRLIYHLSRKAHQKKRHATARPKTHLKWFEPLLIFAGMNTPERSEVDKHRMKCYTSFIFSWLIAGVVVPAMIIMVAVHNEGFRFYIYDQYEGVASNLSQRTDSLARVVREKIPLEKEDAVFLKERDTAGQYFKCIWHTNLKFCKKKDNYCAAGGHEVFLWFNSQLNRYISAQESLGADPLIDSRQGGNDTLVFLQFERLVADFSLMNRSETRKPLKENPCIIYTANENTLNISGLMFSSATGTLVYDVVLAIIVILVYFLVRKIMSELYVYKGLYKSPIPATVLLKQIKKSGRNAVIVSLHGIPAEELKSCHWHAFDISGPKEPDPDDKHDLLFHNFDYKILSPEDFEGRIERLKACLMKPPAVLLLEQTPLQLVKGFRDFSDSIEDPAARFKFNALIGSLQQLIFNIPVMFCVTESQGFHGSTDEKMKQSLENGELLDPGLLLFMSEDQGRNPVTSEVEKIRMYFAELSRANYAYTWSQLDNEEQFILYGLARGYLLNMKNQSTISMLYNKGVLKKTFQGEFEIENKAFQYFIRNSADRSKIREFTAQTHKTGSWNRLRVPALLIAASIFIFLFTTQQSILSNLNAILVSFGALAGVILRFGGLFTKESK